MLGVDEVVVVLGDHLTNEVGTARELHHHHRMSLRQCFAKLRLTVDFAQHKERLVLAHQPLADGCRCGYILRYPWHNLHLGTSLTEEVHEILHRGVGAGIANGDDAAGESPTLLV